jgi:hypothetical protein
LVKSEKDNYHLIRYLDPRQYLVCKTGAKKNQRVWKGLLIKKKKNYISMK